ncbi:MAG: hypothetical protein KBT69_09475, partial [Oceanihabitans sp.]|nr:hypothetical protein [Oceanihabitans sp.]
TIPNREVKPICADGTTLWKSRSSPFLKNPQHLFVEDFFCIKLNRKCIAYIQYYSLGDWCESDNNGILFFVAPKQKNRPACRQAGIVNSVVFIFLKNLP